MVQVACVGLIENEQGEVLITQRGVSPFKEQYVMPGGKLDKGESVFDCVEREVFEEVGIKATETKLFDIYEVFLPHKHYLILYFLCKCSDFNVKIDNIEVIDFQWVNKDNFRYFNVTEGTDYILSKFFNLDEVKKKKGIKDFRGLI